MFQKIEHTNAGDGLCRMVMWGKVKNGKFGKNLKHDVPRSILYIECRPGGHGAYLRELRLAQMMRHAMSVKPDGEIEGGSTFNRTVAEFEGIEVETGMAHIASLVGSSSVRVLLEEDSRQPRREIFSQGLRKNWFADSHKIRQWIFRLNELFVRLDLEIPPLQLLVVHAHSESEDLERLIDFRPAAVIGSGSGEMLDERLVKEPWCSRVIDASRLSMKRGIPQLGICFSQHVLGYAAYGELPRYHRVPKEMDCEFHSRIDEVFPVKPGVERLIYGCRRIRHYDQVALSHPIMRSANDIDALEAHAMGFEIDAHPGIPASDIKAFSRRHFFSSVATGTGVDQNIIEVIAPNEITVGIQAHPELSRGFLSELKDTPAFYKKLTDQGYDPAMLDAELALHQEGSTTGGELFGINFTFGIVGPNRLHLQRESGNISASQLEIGLEALDNALF